MLEFNKYKVLTFDCYGTLIDWESGILMALKPIFLEHNIQLNDDQILEVFAELESNQEKGRYIKYQEVLRNVVQELGNRFNFKPGQVELDSLANSLKNWQPFPDTVAALKDLQEKFKLAIISNVDDDLFSHSQRHLNIEFDWVITAEQAKSYKPSLNNFKLAIERIGLPIEEILHVASSIYHDIVPANSLGLSTAWIDRRSNKVGSGASPLAVGQPSLKVPDLKTLAAMVNLSFNDQTR